MSLLVGYWGRRVTSKYMPNISPKRRPERRMWLNFVPERSKRQHGRSNNAIRVTRCPSWEPFRGQKAVSLQVYIFVLLLWTQPTQHRVRTKAPKLRRWRDWGLWGPRGQFHCRFILFRCFSGRSRHITESAPRPLSYGGRGTRRHLYCSCIEFFISQDAADAAPSPHQGP